MCGIYDAHYPLLFAYAYHLFPRQIDAGVANQAIDDADHLRARIFLGGRWPFEVAQVLSEVTQDFLVRLWERQAEHRQSSLWIEVMNVLRRLGDIRVRGRS